MTAAQKANDQDQQFNNPYLASLNKTVDDIMRMDVAGIQPDKEQRLAHINLDNDWAYPRLAGSALVLAYAWDSPRAAAFHQKAAWLQMEKIVNSVLDSGKNGKWWRELPGTGDDNINRFTMLPLMEIFMRVGNRFTAELRKKYMDVFEKAMAEQLSAYHRVKNRCRGEYPNMDAYFMLIMEEAARILNCAEYHAIALEYLGWLEVCLFTDGGFVYYKGSNECESYHQIAVMTLVRLWELTQSDRILQILRRTLPYYPNVIEPSGVVECYTDPFWKHYWGCDNSVPLDVLATLFPDAPEAEEHRYLANRLRESGGEVGMFHLWALDYWEAGPGVKPRDRHVRYDASIRGPRGRFGSFSWAGTTGTCLDTFVGAMSAAKLDRVSALQAAGAEIILVKPFVGDPEGPRKGRRFNQSAYVTGHDYVRRTIIADQYAGMGASSPLFNGEVAWQDFFPDSGWQTHQAWLFCPERLIGMMVIEAAHADKEPAKAVRFYLRLGGTGLDVVEKDGLFVRDELKLRVVKHNMDACSIEPAYAFYLDAKHTSTEVILSSTASDLSRKPFMAIVEIFPACQKPAAITELSGGACAGFVLSDAGTETMVALNYHGAPMDLAELKRGWKNLYRTSSRQACKRPAKDNPGGSILPGELILASDI